MTELVTYNKMKHDIKNDLFRLSSILNILDNQDNQDNKIKLSEISQMSEQSILNLETNFKRIMTLSK